MITPSFAASQTQTHLILKIFCPSINPADVEIFCSPEEHTFSFSNGSTHLLRLKFSAPFIEDDESTADYDISTGQLIVRLTKVNPGETFQDLERPDSLLDRSGEVKTTAQETQVDSSAPPKTEREILLEAEANSWRLPQILAPAVPAAIAALPKGYRPYGFLDLHAGLFVPNASSPPNDLNELGPKAETLYPEERRRRSAAAEDDKFDPGYYQGDYVYDEEIQEVLRWSQPDMEDPSLPDDEFFTDKEKEMIASLPSPPDIPSPTPTHLLHALLFLLLSTTYDSLTTLADPNPESAWTLTALTPLFTSLTSSSSYPSILTVLISSYRRMLSFPLYRSWDVAERVRVETVEVLRRGRAPVARALLGMKSILDGAEVYEVYSRIWVDEMTAFVLKHLNDEKLALFAEEVHAVRMLKGDSGWDLEALEQETREAEGDAELD